MECHRIHSITPACPELCFFLGLGRNIIGITLLLPCILQTEENGFLGRMHSSGPIVDCAKSWFHAVALLLI